MRYLLLLLLLAVSAPAFAGAEFVLLAKVLPGDERLVVQRLNGDQWLIAKGSGANSAFLYLGRQVIIISPNTFCGRGSSLFLIDVGQEAPLTAAEQLAPGSVDVVPVVLPPGSAGKVAAALSVLGLHRQGRDPLVALGQYQAVRGLQVEPKFTSKLLYSLAKDVISMKPLTPANAALAESLAGEARLAAFPLLARSSVFIPRGTISEAIIDGEFKGWDGKTVFRLTNRWVWQQIDLQLHLHLALSPKVLLINDGYGVKAKVEGVNIAVDVIPLR
jgi:hypothetical protein